MLQIENEYGSYGNNHLYLQTLRKLWIEDGIDVPFYTADGPTDAMLEAGSLKGLPLVWIVVAVMLILQKPKISTLTFLLSAVKLTRAG